MQITLKLYTILSAYLPPGAVRNVSPLTAPDDATVDWVIQHLQLPPELVHLVLINGFCVAPEERASTLLKEADTLAIWPPLTGG